MKHAILIGDHSNSTMKLSIKNMIKLCSSVRSCRVNILIIIVQGIWLVELLFVRELRFPAPMSSSSFKLGKNSKQHLILSLPWSSQGKFVKCRELTDTSLAQVQAGLCTSPVPSIYYICN